MKKILIVEDDLGFGLMLETYLKKKSFDVHAVLRGKEGLQTLKKERFDLVISDLRLPDIFGLELLASVKKVYKELPVILMTGYADIKSAVEAMKLGAADYLTKPVRPDELLSVVQSILDDPRKPTVYRKDYLAGTDETSRALEEQIDIVAPTDLAVIIEGESGTGKEYVANTIHQRSKRKDGPFVAVDCGALPKELTGSELFGHVKGAFTGALEDKTGHFAMAKGGTLFLDEVGNLNYEHQVLLLRAMQEKSIRPIGSSKTIPTDVRIVVATNESLSTMVTEKKFREDLFFRLNEFSLKLFPLRERKTDLLLFIDHFLKLANETFGKKVQGFEKGALQKLKEYHWPGNLRELHNIVRKTVLLAKGEMITTEDLPREVLNTDFSIKSHFQADNLKLAKENTERQMILKALEDARYNKAKAARMLQIDRKTLYAKIALFDIDA